ncbi:MAG TPA: hypothetical protein VK897_26780 [Anaerolineales bacterium]|nr:hypothetical protein [Anaerolineales bacterium]
MLLEVLKSRAVERGLLKPQEEIDIEKAFLLVRDMPYTRASSRDPETIIQEWRGTCSGKHYLLKRLFAELGYTSRLIACTTVTHIDPQKVSGKLRRLLEQSQGRFVDVHNYLVLELPEKEMIVDATWPLATRGMGTVVNERFVPGEDHRIACKPLKTWVVPEDRNAQEFKDEILKESFTPQELAHREEFIRTLGKVTNNRWIKLRLWLDRLVKGSSVTH